MINFSTRKIKFYSVNLRVLGKESRSVSENGYIYI